MNSISMTMTVSYTTYNDKHPSGCFDIHWISLVSEQQSKGVF